MMLLASLATVLCLDLLVEGGSGGALGNRFMAATRPALSEAMKENVFATAQERALEDYPFGPASEWRQDVRSWRQGDQSGAYVQSLVGSIEDRYGGVAAFNTDAWATPYYIADSDTPKITVAFSNCHGFAGVPTGLFGAGGQFENVPIPEGARPATESDSTMSIYSPSDDALWEFWNMKRVGGRWTACWGGRIDHASSSPGFFKGGFGASGTGLSYAGGMVRLSEVDQGVIPHAIAIGIPNTAAQEFVYPAQRTDGWDETPGAVPEGTRFRLPSDVRIDQLHLSPLARLIAVAAKKYGFVVTDTAGAVAISGQGQKSGTDAGWRAVLKRDEGYNVLRNFPWSRLEAVESGS